MSSSPVQKIVLTSASRVSDTVGQLPTHVDVRVSDGSLFRCPIAILCQGSRTLADLLVGTNISEPLGARQSSVEMPLSSLSSSTFQSVMMYLEHFYATDADHIQDPVNQTDVERPTLLSAPLEVRNLYYLSDWEHRFVTQQLMLFPEKIWGLSVNGQWVDAPDTRTQCDVQHLLSVLEAASFLEILSLRSLCSAVLANILADMSDQNILGFFGVKKALGSAEEEALLREYPWIRI